MDIDAIRARIPATRTMTYMNTGWAGPTPQPVTDAIKARLEYEADAGPTAPEVNESGKRIAQQAKEAVAGLLNASAREVLLTQNTTEGLNIVANGLSWNEGDEVITFSVEHASPLLAAYHLRDRWGVRVKRLPVDTDATHDTVLSAVGRRPHRQDARRGHEPHRVLLRPPDAGLGDRRARSAQGRAAHR